MNDGAKIRPGSPRAYVLGARPKTLLIAVAPVLVGAATAWAARARGGQGLAWRPLAALAALLGAVLITVGTNYANDVFDHEKGADTAERLGPTRVTAAGLLTPTQVRAAMAASFLLATVCGVYLTAVAGWPVVAIGLCSIVAGIAYTGGPYPLGYNGLGEVFVFVFFGLVAVCGTSFVTAGAVPPLAWITAVPSGSLAACVLLVNNVRDVQTDAPAGKRTLAVRFGRGFGVGLYGVFLALALGAPALAWGLGLAGPLSALLPAVLLLPGARLVRAVHGERGATLNARLGQTAGLLLAHGVLFSLGLVAR
jgi:1,4-dihydroxy-2-naphthoate octaprenyltransferase